MFSAFEKSHHESEAVALKHLLTEASIDEALRQRITHRAVELVTRIREDGTLGIMELFLEEYGLSSEEGVALMCLAEALLRVPDEETMDDLIEDKIAPSEWGQHLGKSHSSLVNASTWALMITGKVLKEDARTPIADVLHGALKRLGEPIIRQAVRRAMKEMGNQFVLGETIEKAVARARKSEAQGYTYSYDMLGEAARTEQDAKRYHLAYSEAITELGKNAHASDLRENPGISIKLSALHPRYETLQHDRVMEELVPRARSLAVLARSAGIGLNIDAEEAGRLELSLAVIDAITSDAAFRGWDGFGIVVQAYNLDAPKVIDWLYALAEKNQQKFLIRLVKGAYWDTEIKLAQVEGHDGFPVYTRKPSTDVSYICCAQKLLGMTDRIYPQFATHNAHTVAAILEMAEDKSQFEFQRLHGMGEALHDTVMRRQSTKCRIYAPVGAHEDLLAYLVRRLLENGANSSFVNQIVDESVAPEQVAVDPFGLVESYLDKPENRFIKQPDDLFEPQRPNSEGWDLSDPTTLAELEHGISQFDDKTWAASTKSADLVDVINPATGDSVGSVQFADHADIEAAFAKVKKWDTASAAERSEILNKAADLYEENAHEIFALLMREAGKTLLDCVGELREAVDFLRYYAAEALLTKGEPAGVFTCISPWNFPLAIFTGQVAAALATGNGVLAKPAESTNLIARFAVSLLWKAGVPQDVLLVLPGTGAVVGAALSANPAVNGVCFTGSTATAQKINQTMAEKLSPEAPLIAETGGLNAMIVDSTALPEQAVADIVQSAFQSAGQRCSALRVLYLQKDIADAVMAMLGGAMDELCIGDPRDFSTDIGPIINEEAAGSIQAYIAAAKADGRLLATITPPSHKNFVPPTIISVEGIEDVEKEIFGPVLHVATYEASELDDVIDAINAKGFGLTFCLHSRIDDRVQHIIDRVEVGNIYINRNQIGAVVGSQPFGGEGLSGTGPKAGGPLYLQRFLKTETNQEVSFGGKPVSVAEIENAFDTLEQKTAIDGKNLNLPGPTGESNQYSTVPRGYVLCLGPTEAMAQEQLTKAQAAGCNALAIAPGLSDGLNEGLSTVLDGVVEPEVLTKLSKIDAVISWTTDQTPLRQALALREGAIVPLHAGQDFEKWLVKERHVCIDTTAAGGNAALLRV